ncbi:MAG: isochorismate synthase [Propionicimonas sp.]
MIQHPPGQKWHARTHPIDDPGDLTRFLAPGGLAWLRRGDGMIGLGELARFEGGTFAEAEAWWRDLVARIDDSSVPLPGGPVGVVAFASFVFDPARTSQRSVLVVPKVVIGRRKGRSWLTVIGADAVPGPVEPTRATAAAAPVGVREIGVNLTRDHWQDIVEQAVGRIGAGEIDKVVLARGVTLEAAEPLDGRWLVTQLADRYPTCWTYFIEGLVGASPEMLIRREDGLATSRVLAGTIGRNGEEELDLKLAHALARSSKNLAEHELAVESVARALAPFCSGMNVPDAPYVLELPNVLHLASDVTAVAHPDVSALRLAGELHPSAAVCGTPTPVAREVIAELEHLDRGRYSGPVGWLDASGDGEFAIALRCGLMDAEDPRRITIYAGCGIVSESDPAEEYAETEAKLLPMREALGVPTAAS